MFFSGLQVEFLPEVFGRAKHAGIELSLLPRYPRLQVWPLNGGQEGQYPVEGAVTLPVVGRPHVCVDAGAHQLALTEPWPSYPHFPTVEVEVMQLLHDSQVQRVLDMKAKKK